ncbi:MAG: hypothetical protein IPK80_10345 [Nannocystis sp.]|nr:hypothetical protein [Nannocystis sp.]
MTDTLRAGILEAAAEQGDQGVAMGAIVDAMVLRGHRAERVEAALWELLGQRRLTPSGFICRTLRRRSSDGAASLGRVYELLLIPWSPAQDQQLDLGLVGQ